MCDNIVGGDVVFCCPASMVCRALKMKVPRLEILNPITENEVVVQGVLNS
jgi:hypothetical protein